MSGTFRLAVPDAGGGPFLWDAEPVLLPTQAVRVPYPPRPTRLWAGAILTAAAMAGSWFALPPAITVETRVVADAAGPAGRAVLAEAALRLSQARPGAAWLDQHGAALVIAAVDRDAAVARRRVRSDTDSLLDLSWPDSPPTPAAAPPASPPPPEATRRDRLTALAGSLDARAATVSASLTSLARDIAAGARPPAARTAGHEALERGAAALLDLQIQRTQLLTRYQDDYPAVTAIDAQIRSLRTLLQDESRRLDAVSRPPADTVDPALAGERDRLRAELAVLNERRSAITAELAAADRPSIPPPPVPPPERSAAGPASPVLIEGATTVTSTTDLRWVVLPAMALVGLFLCVMAGSARRLRSAGMTVQAKRWSNPVPLPAPDGYLVLDRQEGARLALGNAPVSRFLEELSPHDLARSG